MSTTKLNRTYRCYDDCLPQGCPSHTATLEYQSTSNAYHFNDGRGHDWYSTGSEFEALLSLLRELATQRVETASLLAASEPRSDGGNSDVKP